MKRWLLICISGFTTLLILLTLGCFYLLGTQSGADFLVSMAQKQLAGSLNIGEIQGKILDRLELDTVLFKDPAVGEIRIKHLIFDWKSSDLLRLNLHILELSAAEVSYTPPEPKDAQSKPVASTHIVLPNLNLPVTIAIDRLAITDFSFISDQDKPPLQFNSAILSLNWDKTGITLQQLQVDMNEGSLTLHGTVNPQGNYPTHLTSILNSNLPALPHLQLQGSYEGDSNTFNIRQNITGDITADLHIRLTDILEKAGWNIALTIAQLPPALFNPDLPGLLTGKIAGSGDLHGASATANLSLSARENPLFNWDAKLDLAANLDTKSLDIRELSLLRPGTTTKAEISGNATLDKAVDLKLLWSDMQWPLTNPAQYASSSGTLYIKGQIDDYALELQTANFSGATLPAGQLNLQCRGNSKGVTNLNLTATLLDGETRLLGDVQWAPFFNWQLLSKATTINPSRKYQDWPGSLRWSLKSSGSLKDKKLSTDIEIESLKGILRELPLVGSGKISIRDKSILIDSLTLASAGSSLTADGGLGDNSTLSWKLNIVDFSDLLPKSSGTLRAEGTLQGRMKEPSLKLHLLASDFSFQDLALQQLTAVANLDLSGPQNFSVTIKGTELYFGANQLKKIELTGNGNREAHTIDFQLKHTLAALSLSLKGGYKHESWRGSINQFDIRSQDMGTWQMLQPAALQASSKFVFLQKLCLDRDNSALCLAGSWDAESHDSAGNLSINAFPLQWFAPWFPEPVEGLGGVFSAIANAKMGKMLQADVTAAITPGDIKYSTAQQSGTFPHQGMKLDLKILKNALDASLFLSIDSNTIRASMRSPDILQIVGGGDGPLVGNINIEANKFDLVETLVPAVQNLDAAVNINLAVSGTLHDPRVKGTGNVTVPHVFIPKVGLELKESSLSLQSTDTRLGLKGELNSADGTMNLDGWVDLDSSQNYPLQLTIKSDAFLLTDLPEMQIFLNSNLLLKRGSKLTSLLGELTIPKAEILLRQLPKGSQSTSADVVILQERKEKAATVPLHMDIKATLGKNVHFSGLGLNAFINGQLNILADPGEQIRGSGSLSIDQGSFRAYGQNLDIETGILSFPGGPLTEPGVNLRATRSIGDVIVGILAIGPAKKPRISTFSKPPMAESHIISYLLTGSAPGDNGKGSQLSIGRQINNKLSVSMGTDLKSGDSEFVTRYRLNRNIHIQTTTAGSGNAADIFYSVELGGKKPVEGEKKISNPPRQEPE